MVEFTIIIVAYKNLDILIKCINSIYKYNDIGEKLELIVVDNSPDNEVYDYISKEYSNVRIIKNENNGFGAGNNFGARDASGKYLLFLNPDTILIEPIFKYTIEKFENNPDIALFGMKLRDIELKSNLSFFFLNESGFFKGQILKLFNKLDIFIPNKMFISGANMFMRRTEFIDYGMFDENMFMYNEEKDLTRRIIQNNKSNAYLKSKSIIHLEGKSSASNINSFKIRIKSLKYYCFKYNISFTDSLLREYNYLKKKKFFSKVLGRKVDFINEQIDFLKEEMKIVE